jgi:hypothetical protein
MLSHSILVLPAATVAVVTSIVSEDLLYLFLDRIFWNV